MCCGNSKNISLLNKFNTDGELIDFSYIDNSSNLTFDSVRSILMKVVIMTD